MARSGTARRERVICLAAAARAACLAGLAAAACVSYEPRPLSDVAFLERAQEQRHSEVFVAVAVPSAQEVRELFGVDLYAEGIQPVWVQVQNLGEDVFLLLKRGMDADYYPPGEVAYLSRYTTTGRITQYGIFSPLMLPLTLPRALVERWSVSGANEEMGFDIHAKAFPRNLVRPGDKQLLFGEMYRVLRNGGRAVISDIVCDKQVPERLQADPQLWSGCISGAFREDRLLEAFESAGFHEVRILKRDATPWQVVADIEFRSVTVEALRGKAGPRPETPCCTPGEDCC